MGNGFSLFQVNSSYLSYFNTNFNYSDIVIYIGFSLLGGLNIQSELDKLKYTFESLKKNTLVIIIIWLSNFSFIHPQCR